MNVKTSPNAVAHAPGSRRTAMSRPAVPLALALAAVLPSCAADVPPPLSPPAAAPATTAGPPVAPRRPVVDAYHGVQVADDYQWLERSDDPEVVAWSTAENGHTRRYLDALPDRSAIRARLRELFGASGVYHFELERGGGRLFALEDKPPHQQPFLVTLASADDPTGERVLVDPNRIDPTGGTSIDFYVPSLDGSLCAISLSQKGSEDGTLHVYEAASGRELPDRIPRVNGGTAGGSVTWNAGGTGFYYTRYPHAGERPPADLPFFQQVYFHKLGTAESDDRYALGKEFPRIAQTQLLSSDDGKYVLATVEDGDGGQYAHWLLGPGGVWEALAGFKDGVKEARFGRDGSLYLLLVAGAPRGKILKLDPGVRALARARVVVAEGDGAIDRFVVSSGHLYVATTVGGPSELRVFDLEGKDPAVVPILPVSAVRRLLATDGDDVLFSNVSFIDPATWYRYSASTRTMRRTGLFKTSPASYADAEVVRETCISRDGVKVPLNVLRRKGMVLDGHAPLLLTGYGGFGISSSPRFTALHRLWLDHGGVYALANLRGGGEFGEAWHTAGNLTRKQNVFDDLSACAAHVVEAGYTKPARLAIMGASNGGLLMGAALTQHPAQFRAVVSMVGIYDMLRLERTPNGAFNVAEYGTVKDPEQFRALYDYSPYHHVQDGIAYPAVLFLTGANDPRVDPFHSRKMTARLQAATAALGRAGRPVLLRTSDDTGHGGGTPLDAEIEEDVDVYSFLLRELGMTGG
jgi:prolyl oligopeptidase